MKRVHNFSAGPCTLPLEVLQSVRDEMVDYQASGMSLIEMSHRGGHFDAVFEEAVTLVREQYEVPEEFEILFFIGASPWIFKIFPIKLQRFTGDSWPRK